jgi:hypothetical protein
VHLYIALRECLENDEWPWNVVGYSYFIPGNDAFKNEVNNMKYLSEVMLMLVVPSLLTQGSYLLNW